MKKSPAQQLLEKLAIQQEQQSNTTTNAPLILFQYSSHVSLREAAATRSKKNSTASNSRSRVQQQQQHQAAKQQAEADLYRRAQLRTPAENARRSLWGGPLWLEYLTKQLLMLDKSSQTTSPKLIWISTTTRPQPAWLLAQQAIHKNAIQVVSWAPQESPQSIFCLDDQEEEKKESNATYIHPLVTLLTQIREIQSSQSQLRCIPIVLESVTPWVQLYGFVAVQHFVQQLMTIPHTLILLSVLSETLTAHQHQQWEDLAHTALWLSNHTGQVNLHVLRRGIREQDSTVREVWEFALQASPSNNSNNNNSIAPFRLVVGESEGDEDDEGDDAPEQVNLLEAMNPALNPDARPTTQQQQQQQPSVDPDATGEITKRTNKITLKLENDDDDQPRRSAATTVAPPSASAANPPRIFMQDDDPEFEDYDEEDPDDDLDI